MILPSAMSAVLHVPDDQADFDEVMMAADVVIAPDAQAPATNENLAG